MSRKPLIAANWKMYKTPAEAVEFTERFAPIAGQALGADIVLCASPTLLASVVGAARNSSIGIAAQDMHWLDQGAYTGETSPLMLKGYRGDPRAHRSFGAAPVFQRNRHDGQPEAEDRRLLTA